MARLEELKEAADTAWVDRVAAKAGTGADAARDTAWAADAVYWDYKDGLKRQGEAE